MHTNKLSLPHTEHTVAVANATASSAVPIKWVLGVGGGFTASTAARSAGGALAGISTRETHTTLVFVENKESRRRRRRARRRKWW
jgi:hypothetical protein